MFSCFCNTPLLDSYYKVKAKVFKVLFIIFYSTGYLWNENPGFTLIYCYTIYIYIFFFFVAWNQCISHSRVKDEHFQCGICLWTILMEPWLIPTQYRYYHLGLRFDPLFLEKPHWPTYIETHALIMHFWTLHLLPSLSSFCSLQNRPTNWQTSCWGKK